MGHQWICKKKRSVQWTHFIDITEVFLHPLQRVVIIAALATLAGPVLQTWSAARSPDGPLVVILNKLHHAVPRIVLLWPPLVNEDRKHEEVQEMNPAIGGEPQRVPVILLVLVIWKETEEGESRKRENGRKEGILNHIAEQWRGSQR